MFYAATRQSAARELELFQEVVAASSTETAALAGQGPIGSWEAALTLLAGEATRRKPVIVVIDEFPDLIGSEPAIEASLQAAWRRLERQPLLVVLVGSDISMMEALSTYGAPALRPSTGARRSPVLPRRDGRPDRPRTGRSPRRPSRSRWHAAPRRSVEARRRPLELPCPPAR